MHISIRRRACIVARALEQRERRPIVATTPGHPHSPIPNYLPELGICTSKFRRQKGCSGGHCYGRAQVCRARAGKPSQPPTLRQRHDGHLQMDGNRHAGITFTISGWASRFLSPTQSHLSSIREPPELYKRQAFYRATTLRVSLTISQVSLGTIRASRVTIKFSPILPLTGSTRTIGKTFLEN